MKASLNHTTMSLWFFPLCASIVLVAPLALSQQPTVSDDVTISLRSCSYIEMTARQHLRDMPNIPEDDDHTAAAVACDGLKKAVDASDPQQIQSAATNLRGILARLGMAPASPQEQLAALEEKSAGSNGMKLFYELPELAKRALAAGEADKAEAYAKQLLWMAPDYPKNWNYGNAIFYGNFMLGRVAAQRGTVTQAGQYLLAAGATPGSPQLNTFGPDMTLAKELLEKGQSEVVLQYLALCKNFWKDDYGKLDEWSATVRGGGIPDFTRFP